MVKYEELEKGKRTKLELDERYQKERLPDKIYREINTNKYIKGNKLIHNNNKEYVWDDYKDFLIRKYGEEKFGIMGIPKEDIIVYSNTWAFSNIITVKPTRLSRLFRTNWDYGKDQIDKYNIYKIPLARDNENMGKELEEKEVIQIYTEIPGLFSNVIGVSVIYKDCNDKYAVRTKEGRVYTESVYIKGYKEPTLDNQGMIINNTLYKTIDEITSLCINKAEGRVRINNQGVYTGQDYLQPTVLTLASLEGSFEEYEHNLEVLTKEELKLIEYINMKDALKYHIKNLL